MTPAIDITGPQRKLLLAILGRYIPGVAVWAYGSRVKFTARPNSDLDLVVFTTPAQGQVVSELKDELAESDLPFLVDLHVWDEVPEKFHDIIRKEYVVVQGGEEKVGGGWKDLTLGDLGRIVTGKTPLTAVEENFGGQIPFVTPSDMDGRRTISTTARNLTEFGAASVKGSKIPAGSVMVSCIGSDMGKSVIAGRDCVTNQQINSIVVDDLFSSEFIYYNLSTRKNEIRHQAAGGSAQPILNKGDFSRLEITLPPLAEQKAIAAVLGALDDKIELNRRMNATLEAMARALFQSWFVDFDPVRAKLDARAPANLDKATAALFPASFQDFASGHIPSGWTTTTLGQACEEGGGSIQTGPFGTQLHASDYVDEGIPSIMPSDLRDNRIDTSSIARIREEDAQRLSVYRVRAGDVVYSRRGDVERRSLIRRSEDGWLCGTGCLRVRFGPNGLNPYFGASYLGTLESRAWVVRHAVGATMPNLNTSILGALPVIVPSADLQARFAEIVGPWDERGTIALEQSRTLATLRDTLLPKLLSGELRVNELNRNQGMPS